MAASSSTRDDILSQLSFVGNQGTPRQRKESESRYTIQISNITCFLARLSFPFSRLVSSWSGAAMWASERDSGHIILIRVLQMSEDVKGVSLFRLEKLLL